MNETTPSAIRIVFPLLGATERAMRSAEDTRPDATELNVLVFMYGSAREVSGA
jgi:hypothetical protein